MDKVNRSEFLDFLINMALDINIEVRPNYHGRFFFDGIGIVVKSDSDWESVIWRIAEDGRFSALHGGAMHSDSMGLGMIHAWDKHFFTDEEYEMDDDLFF